MHTSSESRCQINRSLHAWSLLVLLSQRRQTSCFAQDIEPACINHRRCQSVLPAAHDESCARISPTWLARRLLAIKSQLRVNVLSHAAASGEHLVAHPRQLPAGSPLCAVSFHLLTCSLLARFILVSNQAVRHPACRCSQWLAALIMCCVT